jgi:uncharacterized membrane protein
MNKINWTQVGVFAVIVLLVFLIGASLLGGFGGYAPGMMGPGMMGGWGFGPFAWLGMTFMWIVPLGFLTLLTLGVIWLIQQVSRPSGPVVAPPQIPPGRLCPNCSRPTQADWQLCPYCGQALA